MQANQQMQVINQKQRPNGLVRRGEKEREKQRTNRREKLGSKPERMEREYVQWRKGFPTFLAEGLFFTLLGILYVPGSMKRTPSGT